MKFEEQEVNNPRYFAEDSLEMDNQFERFELLSAYLDGEVTPLERQQVQQLLDNDPQFKKLYTQLLRVQREIPHLPLPTPSTQLAVEQLSKQVFQQIDRQQRGKRLVILGGIASAAVIVAALSSLFLKNDSLMPQIAQTPSTPTKMESEPLMIALNHPAVEIPPEAR